MMIGSTSKMFLVRANGRVHKKTETYKDTNVWFAFTTSAPWTQYCFRQEIQGTGHRIKYHEEGRPWASFLRIAEKDAESPTQIEKVEEAPDNVTTPRMSLNSDDTNASDSTMVESYLTALNLCIELWRRYVFKWLPS